MPKQLEVENVPAESRLTEEQMDAMIELMNAELELGRVRARAR